MPKKQKDILVKDKQDISRPKRYKVVLYNDDYTSMHLVTSILIGVFNKESREAHSIMMNIHRRGKGIAGTYSKQIAETKVTRAQQIAQENGSPLYCEAEPE